MPPRFACVAVLDEPCSTLGRLESLPMIPILLLRVPQNHSRRHHDKANGREKGLKRARVACVPVDHAAIGHTAMSNARG